MIKFKAKHLEDCGFSLRLPGNGGECELIIVTSWGQDNKTKLVIVSAEIDGGVTVLHSGNARVTFAQVLTTVGNVINKWALSGNKPLPEERAWLEKQREKLMEKLVTKWERAAHLDNNKNKAA